MFNTLASYLLGVPEQEPDSGIEEQNERLTSTELDDWVVIERGSDSETDLSNSLESIPSCDGTSEVFRAAYPLHLITRSSSTASFPSCPALEESWFMTPPPCFTSAGPIHMETSPLENLLIEHPSMSVYQHTTGRGHNTVPSPVMLEDIIVEVEMVPMAPTRAQERIMGRRQHHQVDTPRQQQQQMQKCAQKVQVHKACQSLKKRYLERNNKAREVNSRNRRQRRGERSQGAFRSNANNNRKC